MREHGFDVTYTLYPPYRAGDCVNLTAAGERRGGYPEKFACDIYVQPVIIDEDLMSDFAEVNKQC
jgi:hypothetical protein